MKIHSKFKDYYDTARGLGIDEKLHYNRTEELIPLPKNRNDLNCLIGGYDWGRPFSITWRWIGFCGKFYLYAQKSENSLNEKKQILWNEEAASIVFPNSQYSKTNQQLEKAIHRLSVHDDSLFIEFDCPIFTIDSKEDNSYGPRGLLKNPRLGRYEFAKIMPPFQAFQEISMYLGNQLAKQIDPAPLEDKYRIKAHGMDKWSFRNPLPPKRKRK